MSKIASIKVAHYVDWLEGPQAGREGTKKYKVLTVKNSTDYSPGDVLSRTQVDDLSRNARWDVTIVSLNPEGAK